VSVYVCVCVRACVRVCVCMCVCLFVYFWLFKIAVCQFSINEYQSKSIKINDSSDSDGTAYITIGSNDVIPVSTVRDLGIYIDSDISLRSHVAKTVSSCFAALRQIRSIKRSISRPVLQSLVVSMLLTRLDYGSGTLAGTPGHLMDRLQSVRNTAARLVHVFSKEVRPYNAATQ